MLTHKSVVSKRTPLPSPSAQACVLLCFIEPIVGGMGPGASSLRDC